MPGRRSRVSRAVRAIAGPAAADAVERLQGGCAGRGCHRPAAHAGMCARCLHLRAVTAETRLGEWRRYADQLRRGVLPVTLMSTAEADARTAVTRAISGLQDAGVDVSGLVAALDSAATEREAAAGFAALALRLPAPASAVQTEVRP